jgi:hypothetical protein
MSAPIAFLNDVINDVSFILSKMISLPSCQSSIERSKTGLKIKEKPILIDRTDSMYRHL